MEEDLVISADIGTTAINRLSSSLNSVSIALNKLKNHIDEHAFEIESDEIEFFKIGKPRIYCMKIYLVEKYNIETNLPKGSSQMLRQYYQNELVLLERYHYQNQQVYQYYISQETYRDAEFFLRANYIPYLPGQDYHQPVVGFSTNQDYSFSRFRASELLQDFIICKIIELESVLGEELAYRCIDRRKRRWTGDKINLIEIAYGIYLTNQLNDGKADIKEIISWLESSLKIDLNQPYRMFLDIQRRKTNSSTKFLESMSVAIQNHIAKMNEFKQR